MERHARSPTVGVRRQRPQVGRLQAGETDIMASLPGELSMPVFWSSLFARGQLVDGEPS